MASKAKKAEASTSKEGDQNQMNWADESEEVMEVLEHPNTWEEYESHSDSEALRGKSSTFIAVTPIKLHSQEQVLTVAPQPTGQEQSASAGVPVGKRESLDATSPEGSGTNPNVHSGNKVVSGGPTSGSVDTP